MMGGPQLGSLPEDFLSSPQAPVGIDAPSLSDVFSSSFEAIDRLKGLDAQWANQADWMDDRLNDYYAKTGQRLENPLRIPPWDAGSIGKVEQENQARFAAAGIPYPTEDEIAAGGVDKARRAGQRAATLAQGPQALGSGVASFLGGAAQSATDPINAAALALAPEGGLLVRAAGVGGAFALSTGAEGAYTYPYQKQVNPETTPLSIAGEAAMAGLQGAGIELGGALAWRGLGMAWRKLSGARPDATSAPLAVRDAGTVAEKAADLSAQQPFGGLSASAAHSEAISATEKSILEEQPPELPFAAEREAQARRGSAFYPGGKVDLRYELAEADDLVASHDADGRLNPAYPAELQPRDRSAAASLEQINEIASRFEPDRMAPNSDANHGPPIVGPDNVVESGNGRTAAIRRMYAGGDDRGYRAWLEGNGYDTTGFKDPLLIGRRTTPMEPEQRAAFAQSLTTSGLRLNATEQALADARFLSPQAISDAKAGEVDSAGNRDFVRAFLAKVPQSERGAFMTAGGTLSANGKRRLEAALNARAYGDSGVVARLYEHPDPNIKTLGYGLREAAVPWAQMRDAAARGEIASGHDLTEHVVSAVKDVMRARDERRPIWEIMNQGDMFKSDLSQTVARMFFKDGEMTRLASQKDIAANLRDYAEGALQNSAGPRLIGEALTPEEVLKSTIARRGAAEEHTADLINLATSKEALAKPLPEEPAAAGAELERMREQGKNAIFTRDAKGEVVEGVIDRPMAELDAMEAMAKEVSACAGGPAVPEAAE